VIAVGGALLCAVCVVVLVCVARKRREEKESDAHDAHIAQEAAFESMRQEQQEFASSRSYHDLPTRLTDMPPGSLRRESSAPQMYQSLPIDPSKTAPILYGSGEFIEP
jgi:hypothetical protein